MSSSLQINPYTEFLSFLHRVCPDETVSQIILEPASIKVSFSDSSISRSEQERIRDLSQILLPPPTITPEKLLEICRTIDTRLTISSLGATGATPLFPGLGLIETAILAAAVHEWAIDQHPIETTQTETKATPQNSFGSITEAYAKAEPKEALKTIDLAQALAKHPALPTVIEGIRPRLLHKAYTIAEQQTILTLLNIWLKNEIQQLEAEREESKKKYEKERQIQLALLRQELLKAIINNTHHHPHGVPPSQPLFSIVAFSGIQSFGKTLPDGTELDLPAPGMSMFEILSPLQYPERLLVEFTLFSQGVALTALTWAAPAATALKRLEQKELTPSHLASLAARSYCMSLDKIVNDPTVTAFLEERLHLLVQEGILTQEMAKSAIGTFKATLLLQATVALYMSEYGGVTPEEIQSLINGTLTVDESSLLGTMSKLVNLELKGLSPHQKDLFLTSALEQIVSSRSVHSILDPTACFLSLWNPEYSQTVAMSSRS